MRHDEGRGLHTADTPSDAAQDAARRPRPFEVVVLVASLGGVEALATVLNHLSAHFPAAVLVALHLGIDHKMSIKTLARRTKLPVGLATDGAPIEAGRVYIAPPQAQLTVLPDGVLGVAPSTAPFGRWVDALLQSVANAYHERALAAVLTGMGRGGENGVRAIKEFGGTVFAQDEATCMSFEMPGAAIDTGCVDLVLPLQEIGEVIDAVVARGAAVPPPHAGPLARERLFSRGGHTGALMRRIEWSRTPLGAVERWPRELSVLVTAMLAAPFPMFVCWGPELVVLYNDACLPSLGTKHPRVMGQSAHECWGDAWDTLGPAFDEVLRGGEPVILYDQLFFTVRKGSVQETYEAISLSPIRLEEGGVAGVLVAMVETTASVLQVRWMRILRDLASRASAAQNALEACVLSAKVIAEHPEDLPFALFYLAEPPASRAHLAAVAGMAAGTPPGPRSVDLASPDEAWPIADVLRTGEPMLVRDVVERFRALRCEPWGDSPSAALIAPIVLTPGERPVGAIILGLSPRRDLDAIYRNFLDLVIAQVALSVTHARSHQAMSARAARFAALDRIKTEFFNNISHEFRTPLTLILGPLDDLLAGQDGALLPAQREAVELAQQSALRLLDFTSALLDFEQIQTRRMRASFELVDLAAYTRELCGVFREAADRAGVRLVVDCATLPALVPVDREIWEKIVLCLLSNALRSTSAGEIEVTLRRTDDHLELRVRDTGAGIPKEELPHVFEPFPLVRGTLPRTDGGAGLGFALVRELAQIHYGQVRVTSVVGEGTIFTVWVPASLPERRDARPASDSTTIPNQELVRGALRRLADRQPRDHGPAEKQPRGTGSARGPGVEPGRPRVLLVDDDTDLRAYVERLLSARWEVESTADGVAALAAARARPPDLVLAEVLLRGLDGYELLRQIRADPRLGCVPVVLLTARVGDEAVAEGLERGADDVVVKPFSTRELCARIARQIARATARPAGPRRRDRK